ncbi:MAG: PqqD family protein [Eubacterium sp.]
MKIKEGYHLKKIEEKKQMIPTKESVLDPQGIVTLNESGAFLWHLLTQGCEPKIMAAALMQNYEIDIKTACQDVVDFIEMVEAAGFLRE